MHFQLYFLGSLSSHGLPGQGRSAPSGMVPASPASCFSPGFPSSPPSGSGWDTPDAASWGCCCWEQLVREPWSAPIASPVPPVLSSLQETTRCAKALSSNACRTCPGGYCTAVFLARESFSGCHAARCPRISYFVVLWWQGAMWETLEKCPG